MRYSEYKLKLNEVLLGISVWLGVSALLSYFFYRSIIAFILIFMLFPVFLHFVKNYLKEKRDWVMELEFKEMIRILSVNLQSGNSVENSFVNTYFEMLKLFGNRSPMCAECESIVKGLKNNVVIEEMLLSLGERSDNEEIYEFAGIFAIAKRSGGNLREIICDTVDVIDSKIEMKREFRVLISSKKLEHRIMCVIPFFILIYIQATTPGYFDILYGNLTGVMIMSVCLLIYIGAFIWGEKTVSFQM